MKRPPDILSRSPWLEQLPNFRDQKAVREAATVGATPIAGLLHLPKREAEKQLKEALQKIYIPGEQQCAVLLSLIGEIRGVIGERYPDARRFLTNVNAKEAPATIQPVRCLTGLAGIGKSCLLEALKRLLQPKTASFGRVHPDTQIKYVQAITVNTTTSNRDLLMPLANPAFIAGRTSLSVDALQKHVRLWFQRMGIGLLLVDELQFLTQSQTANTRVAQVLLMMGYLGVPVLYAANYSLAHRLLGRPQEERQRLLVNPIDLRPEDPDSTIWQDIVAEYVSVAPDALRIEPARDAKELNFLAGGITRVLRFLLAMYP